MVGRRQDGPPWAWRWIVAAVLRVLRLFGWRVAVQVHGVVPPADTPLVVVANHTSNVDPFLVAAAVRRHTGAFVRPLAKAEVFDVPVLGYFARSAGAIPVAREDGDGRAQAYGAAVAVLRDGGTVYVAPEGTVTHDGTLLPLRHGAARLALEADARVLVVTSFGAQRAFSPVARLPQRDAHVDLVLDVLPRDGGEDATALTGRMAATMLQRSEELLDTYPQADTGAAWWPPYPTPGTPTATARENLERYRDAMTEAVDTARSRMAELAVSSEVEARLRRAGDRARELADHAADRLSPQARDRATELAEQARELAHELQELASDLGEQARERTHEARDRATEVRDRASEVRDRATEARDRLRETPLDRIEGHAPTEGDGDEESSAPRERPVEEVED